MVQYVKLFYEIMNLEILEGDQIEADLDARCDEVPDSLASFPVCGAESYVLKIEDNGRNFTHYGVEVIVEAPDTEDFLAAGMKVRDALNFPNGDSNLGFSYVLRNVCVMTPEEYTDDEKFRDRNKDQEES